MNAYHMLDPKFFHVRPIFGAANAAAPTVEENPGFIRRVLDTVKHGLENARRRAAVRSELYALSDHMLADIGIARVQIESAIEATVSRPVEHPAATSASVFRFESRSVRPVEARSRYKAAA